MTPEERLDLLRRGALEYVDSRVLPEVAHPDFVWDTTTFGAEKSGRTCVGMMKTNKWLADWLEGFEDWSIDSRRSSTGDRVITSNRQRQLPPAPGQMLSLRSGRSMFTARMEMLWTEAPPCAASSIRASARAALALDRRRGTLRRRSRPDHAPLPGRARRSRSFAAFACSSANRQMSPGDRHVPLRVRAPVRLVLMLLRRRDGVGLGFLAMSGDLAHEAARAPLRSRSCRLLGLPSAARIHQRDHDHDG